MPSHATRTTDGHHVALFWAIPAFLKLASIPNKAPYLCASSPSCCTRPCPRFRSVGFPFLHEQAAFLSSLSASLALCINNKSTRCVDNQMHQQMKRKQGIHAYIHVFTYLCLHMYSHHRFVLTIANMCAAYTTKGNMGIMHAYLSTYT